MRHIICFFIGHKLDPHFTDCGYEVCKRCDHHGYHKNRFTLNYLIFCNWSKLRWWWQIKIYDKCGDCHKAKFILGKYVGNHDRCLPF